MYRVLAFGDSNTFGWQTALEDGTPQPRLARRWPVMIGSALDGVEVVEAGLPGRTAGMPARGLPDGIGPSLDGRESLAVALRSANPIDLVLIMLGTNDCKIKYGLDAEQIAACLFELEQRVTRLNAPTAYRAPESLILVPPPLSARALTAAPVPEFDRKGLQASRSLAREVSRLSQNCCDLAQVVPEFDARDGFHLTADSHERLGNFLIPMIRQRALALRSAGS